MKILIKIYLNIYDFINIINKYKISISDLKIYDSYIICSINSDDLNILPKRYKVEILKDNKYYIKLFKNNIIRLIMIFFSIFLFFVLSNLIVEVNIDSNNNEIVKRLRLSLDDLGIKRLSFKKDFISLNNIKNKLKEEYKDKIEWIEIKNIGMTYNVSFELRKSAIKNEVSDYCDVVASSDGIIRRIVAFSGVVLSRVNQSVKKGDVLVSGKIKLNDIEKESVCASAKVYAEKWYSLKIEVPKKYKEKVYFNKYKYNLLYDDGINDYKIFKSRYKLYDSDSSKIISILNKSLYLVKEYGYELIEREYDDDSLENKINELVEEKLELNLLDDEKIISKNVLKKDENDSRIIVELFVIVEKLISMQITY